MFYIFKRTLPRTGETQEIQVFVKHAASWAAEWLHKPLGPTTFCTGTHWIGVDEANDLIQDLRRHTGFKES